MNIDETKAKQEARGADIIMREDFTDTSCDFTKDEIDMTLKTLDVIASHFNEPCVAMQRVTVTTPGGESVESIALVADLDVEDPEAEGGVKRGLFPLCVLLTDGIYGHVRPVPGSQIVMPVVEPPSFGDLLQDIISKFGTPPQPTTTDTNN